MNNTVSFTALFIFAGWIFIAYLLANKRIKNAYIKYQENHKDSESKPVDEE